MNDFDYRVFMREMDKYASGMSNGVMLCILSPILLISVAGFVKDDGTEILFEDSYIALGMLVLLLMVAIGVMYIIMSGIKIKRYQFIRRGEFHLEENKRLTLEDQYFDFESIYGKRIALGVGLCIVSPVPLIIEAVLEAGDTIVLMMVSLLLIMVAIAVNIFIKNSIKRSSYMQLLKVEDFDPNNREAIKREEYVGSIYWPVVVAIFLGWSFVKSAWMISWIVFPVAGLIYAAIVNFIKKGSF